MKTGEVWMNDANTLIFLGKKMPHDMWMVAPFTGDIYNLKDRIQSIRKVINGWAFMDMSGNEIRNYYHKIYEDEL